MIPVSGSSTGGSSGSPDSPTCLSLQQHNRVKLVSRSRAAVPGMLIQPVLWGLANSPFVNGFIDFIFHVPFTTTLSEGKRRPLEPT